MIGAFWCGAAKLALLLGLSFPQVSAAGTTTGDFLAWERSAQDSFFQISISMLGTVATQVRPEMAKCIDEWYFENTSLQAQRHDEILIIMPEFSEFDPTAFMLGYVESVCGKINGS